MTTVFTGGSRKITRLSPAVSSRLDAMIERGHAIVVGDAAGADTPVQKHFLAAGYPNVTVFCAGGSCRNNVGDWATRHVAVPKSARGFAVFAEKDRAMAADADYGLMVWDGKSPGTLLNVLRLLRAGRLAVLYRTGSDTPRTFRSLSDWNAFLRTLDPALHAALKKRATPDEWGPDAETPSPPPGDDLFARPSSPP